MQALQINFTVRIFKDIMPYYNFKYFFLKKDVMHPI